MAALATIKIGLALSGGGVRAAVFHLGVLARLADAELLEEVTFISTVSGGSIATGLVHGLTGMRWPASSVYLSQVLPSARRLMTETSIERDYKLRLARAPWLLLQGRAKVVSETLQHTWGMTGLVRDLPPTPRWIINATTYQTGKNWRFMYKRMGDYLAHYVPDPPVPVADAVAASAAFPGLIGFLVLRTSDFQWFRYLDEEHTAPTNPPPFKYLRLWDGGVYDNLGVEALYKQRSDRPNYRDEYNFLLVSDASGRLAERPPEVLIYRPKHLIDIATDQVRSLRARRLVEHFAEHPNTGAYIRIGNDAAYIARQARVPDGEAIRRVQACLTAAEAIAASAEATHLRRLAPSTFERLCRHGWEVADVTLSSYCPDLFEHRPWVSVIS